MDNNKSSFITLTNIEWRDILFRLKKSESILVIGPGVLKDSQGVSLYENLCRNLEKEMGIEPSKLMSGYLFQLAEHCLRQRAGESILIDTVEQTYKEKYSPEILSKISRIPFHLLISASPGNHLREAFNQNNIDYNFGFYNFNSSPGKVEKPSVEKPLLYYLFGSVEEDDSLILTHDNLFEFIFAILGSKQLPIEIRDELRKIRNFIFLGFDFSEWYLKIIFRLLELHTDKNSYAYAWKGPNKENLSFFANEFKLDFINGDMESFIHELYQKCEKEGLLREAAEAPSISDKVKKLIAEDEINEAVDVMDDFLSLKDEEELLNQVFLISGRYNRLLGKIRKKVISNEDANVEQNQITNALLDVVAELDDL